MVMNHLCSETPEADVGIVNVGLNLCRCFFTSQKKRGKGGEGCTFANNESRIASLAS